MSYSDEELEGAVSGLVRSEVETTRTELGPLNTDSTWSEVSELVSSTLVFDPSAVFYLLSLSANRVNQDVENSITVLDDLIVAIQEMGYLTTEVTQTSLLDDAANALLAAETLLTEKQALADGPYNRFNRALEKFESVSLAPNIRRPTGNGFPNAFEIARTPQAAQDAIRSGIASLKEGHSVIIDEAKQLTAAFDEFLAGDLPKAAIRQSLTKVRTDIKAVKNELDSATKAEAIGLTRDAFLRLKAGEAVTDNLRTISDPRDPRMIGNSANNARARAAYGSTSSSTAAEITNSIAAPYLIEPGSDGLVFAVDNGVDQSVTLVPTAPAHLVGQIGETFDLHVAQQAMLESALIGPYTIEFAYRDFDVYVDGVGYRAELTSGSQTVVQVANAINNAYRLDGESGLFGDVAWAIESVGRLQLMHATTGEGSIVIGDQESNAALGFIDDQDTDDSVLTRGVDANNVLSVIVDNLNNETLTIPEGIYVAADLASYISANATYLDAQTAVVQQITGVLNTLQLQTRTYGGGALRFDAIDQVELDCLETLGFLPDAEAVGKYFGIDELEEALEQISGISTSRSENLLYEGNNGEAVLDSSVYYLELPAGTIPYATDNDMLVIKTGPNAGYYPIFQFISGVKDRIEVTRAFRVVGTDEALNQQWELRNDFLTISSDSVDLTSKLEIKTASANQAVGLSVGERFGSTSGLEVVDGVVQNFERADVKVSDEVRIGLDTYVVTAVTNDGYRLEVTPEISNDLSDADFTIYSAGGLAYEEFIELLDSWFDTLEQSQFEETVSELERRVNPLLVNTNPSVALINDAKNTAENLQDFYSALSDVLESYVVAAVARVDAMLNMMEERGLGFAKELLMLGRFTDFLALNKDNSSYGGNLLEKMRAIAQNDVPASTNPDQDNVDTRLTGTYEDDDADDFTDGDDETSDFEFDDSPGFDDEDDLVLETL